MLASYALHAHSITRTGSSSDVHISPTNVSRTNTHQHLAMYPTMRLDVMMRDAATTLCGAVDRCLQQVPPAWVTAHGTDDQPTTERSAGARGGR